MSELKAFDITVAEEGYCEGIVKYRRAVYDKSEADKVIADLEESHKMEVEQLLMEIIELKKERRWRKFSEEMPNEKQWILVSSPNHSRFKTGVEVARWDNGLKLDVEFEVYTHWMPMPPAPKEAK